MSKEGATTARRERILVNVVPAHFALVLGTAGLGIAWRIAAPLLGVPWLIGEIFVWIAFVIATVLVSLLVVKTFKFPTIIRQEIGDSAKLVFYPLIPTGGLLLSIGIRPYDMEWANILWLASAPFNLLLAAVLTGRWIFELKEKSELTPAWLFPVVGNGVVPIAGVPLGYVESGWMFFAIGFVLWIIVFANLFQRLVFEAPMPKPITPSILVLLSPPATFFIAYYELSEGKAGLLPYALIYTSMFLFLVFALNIGKIVRVPGSITMWSLTFPMAALTIATLLFLRMTGWDLIFWSASVFLGLTTLAVGFAALSFGNSLRQS